MIDINSCNHFAYHHYTFQAEFAELSTIEIIFLVPEKVKDSCQQCGYHEEGRTLKEWVLGFWIIYRHRQVGEDPQLRRGQFEPILSLKKEGGGHRNSFQSIATHRDWYCHLLRWHLEEATLSLWPQPPLWKGKVGPGHLLESFNNIVEDILRMLFVYYTNQGYNNGYVRVKRETKSFKVSPM